MSQLIFGKGMTSIGEESLRKIEVILEPQEEGGFTVTVPDIPGLITEGDSNEEVLDNLLDAFRELYLSYAVHDEKFPIGDLNNFYFEIVVK